jgi:hypothetical protein
MSQLAMEMVFAISGGARAKAEASLAGNSQSR